MNTLRVVGTGSSGNTYLLDCDGEILVIDCGIRFMNVKKILDFNIRGIVGAIVTHKHGDHSKAIPEYEKTGIEVWKPYLDENLLQKKQMGDYTIRSFDCVHDTPCVGYLIEHPAIGKMLYATDTAYLKYVFKNLNVILLEMNYSEEYIDRDAVKFSHSVQGHMEKQTTIDCIKANINDNLRNVILCHLSADGADPYEFSESVRAIVPDGVNVDIAIQGLTVEL